MKDNTSVVASFGQMADDVLFNILITKNKDCSNSFLPFLHAHALELSAKAVCYKLNLDLKNIKNGHDIISIYKLIATKLPDIIKYIPTAENLKDYKKLWIPGVENKNNYEINCMPPNILQLELAYFVDNITNLKYGFNKELLSVSVLNVCFQDLNLCFLNLYKFCRDVYATPLNNEMFKKKVIETFGIGINNFINLIITPGILISPDLPDQDQFDWLKFKILNDKADNIYGKSFDNKLVVFKKELEDIEKKNIVFFKTRTNAINSKDHDRIDNHLKIMFHDSYIKFAVNIKNELPKHIEEDCIRCFNKHWEN